MGDMRDRGDKGHRADRLTWLTWPTVLIDLPHAKRDSLSEWPPTSLLLVLGGLWGPQVSAHISRLLTTTIPIKYHFAGEGEAPQSPASPSETVSRKPATVQGLKQWMIEFVISYICWRWRTERCWRWCRQRCWVEDCVVKAVVCRWRWRRHCQSFFRWRCWWLRWLLVIFVSTAQRAVL